MRKYDKKLKIQKANILAEKRYLESKGLISESFHSSDGTPIGVNRNHEPIGSGAESQDDATIISRIEVLKDALRGVELSGDEEQANSIRVLIQDLKNELDSRKNIDRDAFGREINEEDGNDLFTPAFNKLNDMTSKIDSLFLELKKISFDDSVFDRTHNVITKKFNEFSNINDGVYNQTINYMEGLDDSTYDSLIPEETKIYDVYLINDKKLYTIEQLLDKLRGVYSFIEESSYDYFSDVEEGTGTQLGESYNKDNKKEEAWKKFQKDNHVTDKTVKVAWRDFEKEWENKNKK